MNVMEVELAVDIPLSRCWTARFSLKDKEVVTVLAVWCAHLEVLSDMNWQSLAQQLSFPAIKDMVDEYKTMRNAAERLVY
jgi:hypothetical protein